MTNAQIRQLKADAQHLEPVVRVGRNGLTVAVLASVEQALATRELIKVRLDAERNERDSMVSQIAEATGATLIWQVGKVAVYYRPKPTAAVQPL